MKKSIKYESIINAAGRHLFKRNCTDPDVLKKSKLKLKQTSEQFENLSSLGTQKRIISITNCSLTEHEADVQYSRLKLWVESLEEEFRIEMEDILFPAFISLYRKLNSSGNASGARSFYTRHQSNYFKVPELRKMAERFCSDNNNHFTLEVSQEAFEVLSTYIARSDHPVFQYLLNTTLEINIIRIKTEKVISADSPKPNVDMLNGAEEVQDLMTAISRMNDLPPASPLLKMYTIDTGQRKMCSASVSSCQSFLSCGFQDSSIAIWDMKKLKPPTKYESRSLDAACAIGLYHPIPSLIPDSARSDSSVTICHGHSGPVYSTHFTPTNTHLLSCSDDTTLRLWDIASMENTVVYRGHTYPVWASDISKNGQYFLSGSQDRTAKLWTFERTYPLRILAGHTADIDCVAFHPNGMYVASGSADSSVRMWSVSEGNIVRILVGHRGTVLAVAFSPCGKLLASAGEDHRVKIWDVGTSSILFDYSGHHDVVQGLVWISEQLLGSYSADGSVRVWNVQQTHLQTSASTHEFSSYSVPSPWKPVHLGQGHRSSLVCIVASD